MALQIDSHIPEAYYNLGLAHDEKGLLNEATYYYRQALKIKPDYPQALSNLGIIYARSGKLAEAIDLFKKALDIKPDDAITLLNLGVSYEQLAMSYQSGTKSRELKVKAVQTYQKVLELEPDNIQARERLSLIMSKSPR